MIEGAEVEQNAFLFNKNLLIQTFAFQIYDLRMQMWPEGENFMRYLSFNFCLFLQLVMA